MHKFRYYLFAAAAMAALMLAGPLGAQPYGMGGYGGGYGMMGPGYGYGMMGPGYGMMGPGYGMMGPGYGYGMMGGGPGWGMMHGWGGYGPGMMNGYGPGYPGQGNLNLTTDQVKTYLQQTMRNPNLTVGDVKEKDADTITADVVTKQGKELVQRLDFNRHNGFVQPEQ
jgi:hypothetical protein